jgi:hypothetical protein
MATEKKDQARIRKDKYTLLCSECHHGFLRGFGDALNLLPSRHMKPKFVYHGHDIAKTTSSDALSRDWDLVAACITSAVKGERSQDESERECSESSNRRDF